MHTYDVQVVLGAPQPLAQQVALDGVDEFLSTCCATTAAWPHEPTAFDFHATEGRSWRLTLDGDGARSTRLPATGESPDGTPGARVSATASDLVLHLYDRVPADGVLIDGDASLLDLLRAWEPED